MAYDELRHDPALAREALTKLVGAASLDAVAKTVARSVEYAAINWPYAWELTLTPTFLRLNVGQDAVLDITRRGLRIWALGKLAVAAPPKIKKAKVQPYSDIGGNMELWTVSPDAVSVIPPKVMEAHQLLIDRAGAAKGKSPWKYAHSPSAVQVLSAALGRELPQPLYHVETYGDIESAEAESADAYSAPDPLIEKRAVELAVQHYKTKGWIVRSVELEKIGYDLHCSKGSAERHVEVKGLSGVASAFIMTRNEMNGLQGDPHFELFIVSRALSDGERISIFPKDTALNRYVSTPTQFRLAER